MEYKLLNPRYNPPIEIPHHKLDGICHVILGPIITVEWDEVWFQNSVPTVVHRTENPGTFPAMMVLIAKINLPTQVHYSME